MIDIHSHLIYGVDDGAENIETSIEILKKYSENGITDIILTPHYIIDTNYMSNKIDNLNKLSILKKEISNLGLDINLYLGNEIYIDRDIVKYIKDNKMCTLNNSEYILIELPISGIYQDYQDIIENLINIGFKVVLAHPERYITFQNDYNKIKEMTDLGVLLQCNVDSIIGRYGFKAKKTIKWILKNKLCTFIGTDIHSKKEDYSFIKKSKDKFLKYLTKEEVNDIFNENAKKIIRVK